MPAQQVVDPLTAFLDIAKSLGESGATAAKSMIDSAHTTFNTMQQHIMKTAPRAPAPPEGGRVAAGGEKVTLPRFGPLPEVTMPTPQEVIKRFEEVLPERPGAETPKKEIPEKAGAAKVPIETERPAEVKIRFRGSV